MIKSHEEYLKLYQIWESANEKTLTGIGPMGEHMRLAKILYEKHGIRVLDRSQATLAAKRLLDEYAEKCMRRK